MNLDEYRKEIDEIDAEIIALLNRRAEAARNIGLIKSSAGLPILDRTREIEILERIAAENDGLFEDQALARIYGEILIESRRVQSEAIMNVGVETEAYR
jgi:monofunctional chorismate mutase